MKQRDKKTDKKDARKTRGMLRDGKEDGSENDIHVEEGTMKVEGCMHVPWENSSKMKDVKGISKRWLGHSHVSLHENSCDQARKYLARYARRATFEKLINSSLRSSQRRLSTLMLLSKDLSIAPTT